jgi:GH24 family phage-related lysozyme (muramidase)
MRQSVRNAFVPFTLPLEGYVPWLYQDVKGLVSIGIGNLVDPIQLAMSLPFVTIDGRKATREEIVAEWHRIKSLPPNSKGQTAAQLGHLYAKSFTTLRLTREGVDQVVQGKLNQMDAYLARRFPGYETWPADAQLATLSMAWACGPAFRFPKLEAALRDLDFRTAAVECFMPEEKTISGLRPRNIANRVLYNNAAVVLRMLDPDELHYPTDLNAPAVDREAETLPELPDLSEPEDDEHTRTYEMSDFTIVHPAIEFPPRNVKIPGDDS